MDGGFRVRGLLDRDWPMIGFVLVIFALVVLFGWAAVLSDKKESEACRASGGHRVTHTSHGVTSDGKTFTITETECVHDQPR